MTDLQCPAVVLFVPPDLLGADASIPELAETRYAGVFLASPIAADPRILDRATLLAEGVSCRLDVLTEAIDSASLTEKHRRPFGSTSWRDDRRHRTARLDRRRTWPAD